MKLVSAGFAAVVLALAATGVAAPSAPKVVNVTILPNLNLTFSPATFKRGTVLFRVTNRAPAAHKFSVNGVTTHFIRPHRTTSITLAFKRAATYTATLPDCGYLSLCAGGNPDLGPIGSFKVT